MALISYPISKIQESFLILDLLYPGNTAYHIPSIFLVNGMLNKHALHSAILEIAKRHEALRTYFTIKEPIEECFIDESEFIIIIDEQVLNIPLLDDHFPESIASDLYLPFDLTKPPLFRVNLYTFTNGKTILTIVFHHIIIDLFSKDLFAKELSIFYKSFVNAEPVPQLKSAGKYSEYIKRNIVWQQSVDAQKMNSEWSQNLPDATHLLELASDRPRSKVPNLKGERMHFELDESLSSLIKIFARSNSVNAFTILLTAYSIFLHRFSNQDKIIIGVPFTNRRNEEDQETFGCFVNTLPIEINFADRPTVIDLIKQIRLAMLQTHRRQEVSFTDLVKMGNSSGLVNYNAFFQAGFTFEHPMDLNLSNVDMMPLVFEKKGAQLDLFLTMWESKGKFNGYWEYATALFERSSVESWNSIFQVIIQQILDQFTGTVDEIDILTPAETNIINTWNSTETDYEMDKCIHKKFEEQVDINPQNIALKFSTETLTYLQLNQRANSLAHTLIQQNVKPGNVVAFCLERSPELIITILGILKSGAAYLPLGTDYPNERIMSILEDSNPSVIIVSKTTAPKVKSLSSNTLFIEDISLDVKSQNPKTDVTSKNLAYILYTSGSTGKPKGVMIEHHSVLNRIGWMQKEYSISDNDVLLQKTPVTFDVSVWELFWWFWEGASLVLLPHGGEKDPDIIINNIAKHKVSVIHFVPSMFRSFTSYLQSFKRQNDITSLRQIFQSGEALPENLVTEFYTQFESEYAKIINLYGPTEATVDVSHFVCHSNNPVYIGKPIDNTGLYIINAFEKVQPVGVPGELIITGVNLSRGYLNRPELNEEKFFNFSFNNKFQRAYHTGDLCRWKHDGNIEYLGRIDHQIKLRGFRIELGEIEIVISEHPQIESAVVLLNTLNTDNKYLVGYYSLKNKFLELPDEDLRIFLRKKLPDYMIPSFFVNVPNMPLTNSGKLDRKQLALIKVEQETLEVEMNLSHLEEKIYDIWSSVLKQTSIGPNVNFFDVGGNSLIGIQVVGRLKTELNIQISIMDILQYPTIRSLAEYISKL